MVYVEKATSFSCLSSAHRHFFVCVRCNKQGNLEFRTTKVKYAHLTLAAIPNYVGVDISFKKLRLRTCGKIFASVRSIIP